MSLSFHGRIHLLMISFLLVAIPVARAQSISGGAEYATRYMWRGFMLADVPAIQPHVDLSLLDDRLYVGLWGSIATADRDYYHTYDELDLSVSYSVPLGNVAGLTGGLGLYTYPNNKNLSYDGNVSPEFFISTTPALPLAPVVNLYYDINLSDGFFTSLVLSQDVRIGLPLSVRSELGYNINQFGLDAGLTNLDVGVSTDLPVGSFIVRPRVAFVHTFETIGAIDNTFLVGLHVGR